MEALKTNLPAIMPVRRDVHRAGGAACLADEPPADNGPRLILGQGVEPNVDHPPVAFAAETVNAAGDMAGLDPLCGTAGRIVACPFRVSTLHHAA